MPAFGVDGESVFRLGALWALLTRLLVTPLWKLLACVRALLPRNNQLEELVSSAPVVLFKYESPRKGVGRFLYVSGAVSELCGAEAEELLADARVFCSKVEPSDYDELIGRIAEPMATRQRVQHDIRLTVHNRTIWLRVDAKIDAWDDDAGTTVWCGCMMDVTHVHTAHDQTEAMLAVFESARSLTPMGMWEYDVDAKKFICDAYSLQILDIPAEECREVEQIFWEKRVHPEDSAQLASTFKDCLRTGKFISQFRVIHRDGSMHWVHSTGVAKVEANEKVKIRGIHCDITPGVFAVHEFGMEQKNTETAGLSKAMFLASMSHEIRSPMNGILGMLFLLSDSRLTDTQKQWVEDAKTSAQNLLVIINDVLDLSKLEAGKLTVNCTDFSPEQVLRNIVSLLKHQAHSKGISLDFTSNINNQVYVGDAVRFHQVASNLIGNAVKFTGEGSVSVVVRVMESLADSAAFPVLRVEITDTGIGIPKDRLKLLFKPFSQSDSSITQRYGGTGLGLAISKELVELMGGEIGVESKVGQGSTFWFELTLEKACSSQPTPELEHTISEHEKPDDQVFNGLRVLVADDSIVNQRLISAFLADTRCHLKHVLNGEEALEAVESDSFDLVLMDIQMPVMDGITAAREIRKLPRPKSDVYIIGLTASGMQEDRDRTLKAGVDDYVIKPVTRNTLLTRIDVAAQRLRKRSVQAAVAEQH